MMLWDSLSHAASNDRKWRIEKDVQGSDGDLF